MLLRRLFGVLLILVGLVLALPGVPGPGLLIVLIGATLAGFPTAKWIEPHLGNYPRLKRLWHKLTPPPGESAPSLPQTQGQPPPAQTTPPAQAPSLPAPGEPGGPCTQTHD